MKNVAIMVPTLANGGAEKVAANLSIYLSEKYNISIILYKNEIKYDYSGEIYNIDLKKKYPIYLKPYSLLKRALTVKKLKKKLKIDYTISFMEDCNFTNILSRYKDKVFVSVRNYNVKHSNKLTDFLIRKLYNKSDKVVVVSRALKKIFIDNYGIKNDKIKVIYNSYDIEKINSLSKQQVDNEYKRVYQSKVITNMGRLHYQKGQVHLIRAFSKLKKEFDDVNLVIIGDGSIKDKLVQTAKHHGVFDSVYFLGFLDNPLKYIANSDLFVFPSKYEGFPNALCEAMACSVPVISCDCKTGPNEILCNDVNTTKKTKDIVFADYGVLIPEINDEFEENNLNKQEEMLYIAMSKMINDMDISNNYALMGRQRVKEFSINTIVKEWIDLLA